MSRAWKEQLLGLVNAIIQRGVHGTVVPVRLVIVVLTYFRTFWTTLQAGCRTAGKTATRLIGRVYAASTLHRVERARGKNAHSSWAAMRVHGVTH